MRMVIQGSYQIIYCLALGFLLHLIPFLCADEGSNTKKPIQYRNQGDRAYKNQSYSSAERFYRQYWKHADNEALIVDAAIALLKSLIIQDEDGSRNAAFDVIDKTLERLDRFHPETTEEGVSTHKAQLLYWKGRLYYDAASYEEALKSFQSALSSPDTLSRARVFLGIAQSYMALKQWPHAIKAVDNARKLEANDRIRNDAAIIDIKLALLQNQMERAEELINDHWRNADKTFQSRLAILRITLELKQKKTKEAFQFFHKNSATIDWNLKEPDVYPILYQLAKTLHKEKLFSEAYTVFSTLLPRLHREKHRQDTLLAAAETAVAAKKIAIAINNYKTFIQLYKDHDPRVDKLELIVADLYRDSKNNKLAIDTYRTIHSNQKRDPALRYQALYRLATLYFEQKNYQNAIEAFRAAAALDIEDTDKIHCLMFEANAYFKLKNYAKSAQTYEKISQRFPNSPWAPDADYNAALNFYNGKQYAKAIEQFIQFSQKWPGGTEQMAQARLLTGLSQRRMAQYNDAMKTLHDFISTYQQHEDIPLALLEIAEALTASNKLEVAVIYLGRIIEKYSETAYYPQALYHRAALKLSLGEKNALADSFLFVTKFSQAYPLLASDVYFWIGDYYSNHNDHQSARRFFLEIVKQFPNSENAASALYEAANNSFLFTHLPEFNIAQKNEYLQEAQTQLQRSLKDYPKSSPQLRARIHFLQADILSEQGNYKKALADFERSLNLLPSEDPFYHATLGRMADCHYALANNYAEAEKLLLKILDEKNGTKDKAIQQNAIYRLAKVYQKQQRAKKAIDYYEDLFYAYDISRSKPFVDWYYFARAGEDLVTLYLRDGRYQAAIRILRRMADAKLPISDQCRHRAEELEKAYQIDPSL